VQFAAPPDLAALKAGLLNRGVWVRPFGDILYLTPALTIPPDDLDLLIEAVAATVREHVV
jgi:adenosylmethionine-8-amino-7-oxononanoate aminotransferase